MPKKNFSNQTEEKNALGKLIFNLRNQKGITLRKFANSINLHPSNMSYIERGINIPTSEVYQKILEKLDPNIKIKKEMDMLFCKIRKIPTPEVCQVILNNYQLGERIKSIGDKILTKEQLNLVEELFKSFC